MRCVQCGDHATTTAAGIPVCENHWQAYAEEGRKYLPDNARPVWHRLQQLHAAKTWPLAVGFCKDCANWEPRDAMKELGYKPSEPMGLCVMFSKLTEAMHGIKCTAFRKDHP